MGKEKNSAAGDARLRRLAYGAYAKAMVCRALGGEMLAEAPRYVREALGLYRRINAPTEEDLALLAELEGERRANK